MSLTRQDLQRVYDFIKQQSVMDSQFPAVSEQTGVGINTEFSVLSEGKNKRATAVQLLDYIQTHIDPTKVNVSVSGLSSKKLNSALAELLRIIRAGRTGGTGTQGTGMSGDLVAHDIGYVWNNANGANSYIAELNIFDVESALNYILGVMFGYTKDYWTASINDINSIFN